MAGQKEDKALCRMCGKSYSPKGISRHLTSCLKKTSEGEKPKGSDVRPFYHVLVKGADAPIFWLHLKVDAKARLKDLDTYLRNIWLECCGHMSSFSYDWDEIPMNAKVDGIFRPGLKLDYTYDFGSSTELDIKVIDEYEGPMAKKKKIEIMARNEMPKVFCNSCKAPATLICSECIWESPTPFVCDKCAKDHKCGEEMLLEVVNSPRCGVCAYEGPSVE